jgi:hypothetical protein
MVASTVIDDQRALGIVLSGAQEPNYNLYEIVWELNSQFPDAPLSEKYRAPASAIRELFARGWIHFFKESLEPDGGSRYQDFIPADLDALLENPVTWYPYSDEVQIGIESTALGQEAYRSREDAV